MHVFCSIPCYEAFWHNTSACSHIIAFTLLLSLKCTQKWVRFCACSHFPVSPKQKQKHAWALPPSPRITIQAALHVKFWCACMYFKERVMSIQPLYWEYILFTYTSWHVLTKWTLNTCTVLLHFSWQWQFASMPLAAQLRIILVVT